ncbi:phage tail domain-containing protein [Peribacillus frigoritolerans]|uniref:phage tail domain-containing protein n=1 Tax=Peribacillus frigoritolerans TaxID=450367 RepID=UPI00207ADE3E|nr:phage tail domain-containing protein [Peribacillus frigoritolerans]USK66311.1 phage tail family protein [Peribacillus frigoritolerans]
MFKIYDENFNPVPLPTDAWGYGLRGLDFEISSTAQEVTEHSIPGLPGSVITGFRDSDREVNLRARLKVENSLDFRNKRDQVYAFFKRLGPFYVAEEQQDYKVLKVCVVESYQFERPENLRTFATVTIPLKIIGQPYWISRYKTTEFPEDLAFDMDIDFDKLTYQHSNKSSFDIFNAGTVPIKTIQEKDNCIITIDIKQSVTSFKLYDVTDRYFEYNPSKDSNWALVSGNKIILNGHYMTMNNTPIMERTNRYFLNLLPGDNIFTLEGLTNYTITFDFRFKFD